MLYPHGRRNFKQQRVRGFMFYTEEDIQPVVDTVTELMGVAGNMIHGKGVLANVVISTPAFGKVWYGDFNGTTDTLTTKLVELSTKTNHVLTFEVNP